MTQFVTVHPVLPARDVKAAVEFYVRKMGFELIFQDAEDEPNYAGVRRDGVELHLQRHDEKDFDKTEKLALRFVTEDVDGLFGEYRDKDFFNIDDAPRKTAWGTYEFSFYDLNGNALFFYQVD